MSALLLRRSNEFDEPENINEILRVWLRQLGRDYVGGHEYDFDYVEPHCYYRRLEEKGLVNIENKKRSSSRWKIARLTQKGEEMIGLSNLRRRRRRRSMR